MARPRLFNTADLLSNDLPENATIYIPPPESDGVLAQITKLDFVGGESEGGREWNKANVTLEVTDHEYCSQAEGSPEKVLFTYGVMLDMENGQITHGPNKNVKLGKLREAAGVNGKPLGALIGQMIQVQIRHKPHSKNEGETVAEVVAIAAA